MPWAVSLVRPFLFGLTACSLSPQRPPPRPVRRGPGCLPEQFARLSRQVSAVLEARNYEGRFHQRPPTPYEVRIGSGLLYPTWATAGPFRHPQSVMSGVG